MSLGMPEKLYEGLLNLADNVIAGKASVTELKLEAINLFADADVPNLIDFALHVSESYAALIREENTF
jgi:hypothetical protein